MLQAYDLFTSSSEGRFCNSDQIVKGHPYSDETDERNLHEDCVNDISTTSENSEAAAFIHCGGTSENTNIKWYNKPFAPINSLFT